MAKTCVISELLPPTNLVASLVAGGSLVAGTTYYYKMVAVETTGSNGRVDSCVAISAPSAEVSAVCDAVNKSIKLDWTAPAKIKTAQYQGYLVYRTTVSGDYSGATAKLICGSNSEGGYPTLAATTAVTFTDTGTRTMYQSFVPLAGVPLVELDGGSSVDRVDEDFIYNAYITAGKTAFVDKMANTLSANQDYQYLFRGFFQVSFTLACFWKINYGKCIFIEGGIRVNTTSDFLMGRYYGSGSFGDGSILGIAGVLGDRQAYLGGLFKLYNSKIIDLNSAIPITSFAGGSFWKPAAAIGGFRGDSGVQCLIKNSAVFANGSNNQFSGDISVLNTVMETAPRLEVSAGKMPTLVGVAFSSFSISLYTYAGRYVVVRDCSMLETTQEFQFHGANYNRVIDLINFTSKNTPVKATAITAPTFGWYLRRWSFNAKITDYDTGLPVAGVAVSIKDKNGNSSVFVDSTATASSISSAVATSITVSNGALFTIGKTIKICSELMTITNIAGNVLTVTRGVQGTLTNNWQSCDLRIWIQQDTVLTDANGIIPEQYLLAETYQGNSVPAAPYKYDTVVYTPHTISITKAGYESYADVTTVGEPISLKLKIKPAIAIRQGIGMKCLALDPQNGSKALLKRI